MSKIDYISTINIDLGARYTGVYLNTYEYGVLPDSGIGMTLCLPEDGGKMTWSQAGRTATRHRIRSNKRRKQAKRLMKLVLQELVKANSIQLDEHSWNKLWEATKGLLNRRGYNRIESETDITPLAEIEPTLVAEVLTEFNTTENILEQWERYSQDIRFVRQLVDTELLQLNKSELKKHLRSSGVDKEDLKQLEQAVGLIKEAALSIIDQVDFGHQHRRDYLKSIKLEIEQDSRFKPVVDSVGVIPFWCLVGNVSNLQLRATRWFFNDVRHKSGDTLDLNRLKSVLVRWLNYWRPETPDEKERQAKALELLQSSHNTLQLLCDLDPNLTIPPYEDQDNRRPPKDQTLLLSPVALTNHYGDTWQRWALILRQSNVDWFEGIEEISSYYDRRSRLPKTINGVRHESPITQQQVQLAYFLQRLLDRTRKLDNYALRYLRKNRTNGDIKGNPFYKQLEADLGSQHISDFLDFCDRYYDEVEQARQGLWIQSKETLLERSNLNPPHKRKLMHLLVGGIIGERIGAEELQAFVEGIWGARIAGNATLRGLCKKIEEVRKEYGNLFNKRLHQLRYLIETKGRNEKEVLANNDDKAIWKVYQSVNVAADGIAQHFQHSPEKSKRYRNVFSLAQIYNLLESDPRGFSSNGLAVSLEQSWRMSEVEIDGQKCARCSRLPADSVRPFDGVLKRVLEKQAYQIANKKAEELFQATIDPNSVIEVHINLEENRFAFTEELLDLKKASAKKRKEFSDKLKRQAGRWLSKTERIKQASKGICPYTGKPFEPYGEIDHIIPRSQSLASGTIYNSEANLIWCSREGNQSKRDERYLINNLKGNYLQKIFGTQSVSQVTEIIESTVARLPRDFIFESLNQDEQAAVRHALFLPSSSPAYEKVIATLGAQGTARVNGTQAWLARRIIEQLQSILSDWAQQHQLKIRYHATRINAEDVSRIRTLLGDMYSEFAKSETQGVGSHMLDAVCVYARAAAEPKVMDRLSVGAIYAESVEELRKLIPAITYIESLERRPRYHKSDIASQPIFKEGIYGEHFLPIWVHNNIIKVGFDPYKNAVEVSGKSPTQLIADIQAYCKDPNGQQVNDHLTKFEIDKHKAFELFDRVWREPVSPEELQAANVLDALHYVTQKKNVAATITNDKGNGLKSYGEIVADKHFSVKINLKGSKAYKASGKVVHPTIFDWQKLLNHPSLTGLLGSKLESMPNISEVLASYFNPGSDRAHSKTRRVYSLPVIASASGGFRIKRQGEDGNPVYQLHEIEGTVGKGFAVNHGLIDWNEVVYITQLRESANLTPLKGRFRPEPESFVAFDQWLAIEIPETLADSVTALQFCPATKDRMYIRVTQPLSVFSRWVAEASDSPLDGLYDLRNQVKVNEAAFFKCHNNKLLPMPRGALLIEKLTPDLIRYRYIAAGNNTEMKQAYQEAYSNLRE